MKSADLVSHLRRVLGTISTRYGDTLPIASLSNVGNVVTIVFGEAHGLKNNQAIVLSGAPQRYALASLAVTESGLCWAQTSEDHDLTANDSGRPNVMLTGTGVAALDDTEFKLLEVPDRRSFSFEIPDTITVGTTSAQGYLLELYSSYYNGAYPVTIVDKLTATLTLPDDVPTLPNDSVQLTANTQVQTAIRVTACVTQDRFFEAYTAQTSSEDIYLVVVLGDQLISRDRSILSDGTQVKTPNDTKWLREFQSVDIFAVVPAKDTTLGAEAKDLAMNEVKVDLFKALVNYLPNTEYKCAQKYVLTPVNNSTAAYNGAWYAHRFTFELATEITKADIYEPEGDRAFRDIEFALDFTLEVPHA